MPSKQILSKHSSQKGKVPAEKTQSNLKSQFPPEMTLLKSQQNILTHLKSNFLFTPTSNIYFKKVFKMTGVKLTIGRLSLIDC